MSRVKVIVWPAFLYPNVLQDVPSLWPEVVMMVVLAGMLASAAAVVTPPPCVVGAPPARSGGFCTVPEGTLHEARVWPGVQAAASATVRVSLPVLPVSTVVST